MKKGRILYLDAYDSFSNNIITLLRETLPVSVDCIKIDDSRFALNSGESSESDAFQNFLNKFVAVVAGPGPGHPANADDVGLIGRLWDLPESVVLPVLGVCLGFQSLALAIGAKAERLREPRHGLVRRVVHCGKGLFDGIGDLDVTLYHSLHVRLGDEDARSDEFVLWKPSEKCPDLIPLAWNLEDAANGPVLMSVRHREKPFWGVQYHPESICSNGGPELVKNWWRQVCEWNASNRCYDSAAPTPEPQLTLSSTWMTGAENLPSKAVHWKKMTLEGGFDVAGSIEVLRYDINAEPLLLESGTRDGTPVNPETGRYSIIGVPEKDALQIQWSASDRTLLLRCGSSIVRRCKMPVKEVFTALDAVVNEHKADSGPADVPFWGGLVGYFSYEAGLEAIDVSPAQVDAARPDVWFVLVERSVVVDHRAGTAFVQSIRSNDDEWLANTGRLLLGTSERWHKAHTKVAVPSTSTVCAEPNKMEYCQKVRTCRSHLSAGDSYELCLTDQTLIRNSENPWLLYRRLRATNPAPFGAYLRFSDSDGVGIDVVGSSPERFLSWSRDGKCQFRPIKGTVKKLPGTTRAKAEEILSSEKERAENLMIVDLIRHDLSGVAGVRNVHVPKLMQVEEYSTVYQLVSVIEGDLDNTTPPTAALAASLPPGSMTGAPKKRSCELLKMMEGVDKPRGLYSGVLGHLDVGGSGDFSVVIRTAFRWSNEGVWRVGAGGAVTALSEAEGEWDEMLAKRHSVLDVLLAP